MIILYIQSLNDKIYFCRFKYKIRDVIKYFIIKLWILYIYDLFNDAKLYKIQNNIQRYKNILVTIFKFLFSSIIYSTLLVRSSNIHRKIRINTLPVIEQY